MGETNQDFDIKEFFSNISSKKAAVIIFTLGLITFFTLLANGFVYDDVEQIVSNPLIHSLANIPYFFMGGTFFDAGTNQIISVFYRPFLSTTFAFLYTFSGGYPFIFHFFQILLHSVNTLLVFILFRKFFKEKIALFSAIVFLIHPINQEAVAYISDLQENLFFFFGMLSVYILNSNFNNIRKILLINIFFLLGLLSKETAILFLPTLIIYAYYFKKKDFNKIFLISLICTTAVYFFLHFYVAHVAKITDAIVPIMQASLLDRVITIPSIIFYYLRTFFFPYQLALGYSWVVTTPTLANFYFPLVLDVVFFIVIYVLGKYIEKINKNGSTIFLFFFSWFIFGLIMHMQLIPLDATVADRWFYFPIVGLLGMIATLFRFGNWREHITPTVLIYTGVIVICVLIGRTMVRNTNWVDTLTLCQHDLQIVPDSYNVQSVCGSQLLQVRKYEEAKQHFAIAVALEPKYSINWYQYGISYEHTGDLTTARKYYRKSIQLSNEVNAYVSLAATYIQYENNPQEAKKIIKQGLKSYPNYQRLQLYLAVCEFKLNNKQQALEIAKKSYQMAPSPESQYVLTQITNDQEVTLH